MTAQPTPTRVTSPSRIPGVTKYRVIALPDSDRLTQFFARPGADMFEVFPAVDGRDGMGVEGFNSRRASELYGRETSAPEKAITLSHLGVMREFAQEQGSDDDFLVVAEDDAQLGDDFEEILSRLMETSRGLGIVVLAHPQGIAGSRQAVETNGWKLFVSPLATRLRSSSGRTYRSGHYSGVLWGAVLYVVRRDAARRYAQMADSTGGPAWLADDWWRISQYAHVDVQVLLPNLAYWTAESTFRGVSESAGRDEAPKLRARVRQSLALRTRVKVLRNGTAVALREIADRVETGEWYR